MTKNEDRSQKSIKLSSPKSPNLRPENQQPNFVTGDRDVTQDNLRESNPIQIDLERQRKLSKKRNSSKSKKDKSRQKPKKMQRRQTMELQINKFKQEAPRIKSVLKGGSDFDSSLRLACTSVTLFVFAFFGFYYVSYMREERNLKDCLASSEYDTPLTADEAVQISDFKNMSKRWQTLFIFTFIAEVLSLS